MPVVAAEVKSESVVDLTVVELTDEVGEEVGV